MGSQEVLKNLFFLLFIVLINLYFSYKLIFKGETMANWEYPTFQIVGVKKEEIKAWREEALKRGYHTMSAWLRIELGKFKPNKGEETRGDSNVSISSYDGTKIKKLAGAGVSAQVRKFINNKTRKK